MAFAPTKIPLVQNTAPVIEFRCLFTSDLRRKQKRWQDGRLKFHTFNKRVMVYDERLNYVGDTHWSDNQLDEGDELELDQGAVLIQVADCLGSKDQDLTELLDKRTKQKEERAAARILSSSPNTVTCDNVRIARQSISYAATPQRPLRDLLGTSIGRYGRALLPATSPFEDKQNEMRQERDSREHPPKRRKVESTYVKAGYARNLTGATLDLSSTPHTTSPFRRGQLWARTSRRTDSSKEDAGVLDLLQEGKNTSLNNLQEPPRHSQRQKKVPQKRAKSGYAQNLTGAVLDLSSSQNANEFLHHHPLPAWNIETKASEESRLDIRQLEKPKNNPTQPKVFQTPLVEKHCPHQAIGKATRMTLHKTIQENTLGAPKAENPTRDKARYRDIADAPDRPPSFDDEFFDIEVMEQVHNRQTSPTISKSNGGQSNRNVRAISISPTCSEPSPKASKTPVTLSPVETSEPTLEIAKVPSKTVGAIRLKSRPKRKMLVFTHRSQPQPLSVSTKLRVASPVEEIVPEQSLPTKKLDIAHELQKKQVRARIGKGKATIGQADNDSSPVHNVERDNTGVESQGGNSLDSASPSKISLPLGTGLGIAKPLPRQSISKARVRSDHSTMLGSPPPLPNETTNGVSRQASESPIPQSSNPDFEQLEKVADRIYRGDRSVVQTACRKRTVPIKPQTMPKRKTSRASKADKWTLCSGYDAAYQSGS